LIFAGVARFVAMRRSLTGYLKEGGAPRSKRLNLVESNSFKTEMFECVGPERVD
jgi:hypothetical protein